MMMQISFDPKCLELAIHFLGENAEDDMLTELAQHIQDKIENWITYELPGLQPETSSEQI